MADNKTLPLSGTGDSTVPVATKEVTHSGDTTDVQLIEVVAVTGTEGSRTLNEISDGSGLQVQGAAAENAAVAGNPNLIGGRYDASPRTLGDGDVGAIALDADGAVQIADGGNTITVDGTVTANLSATDNAVLDSIQTAVEIIDNAISGNEMQVDIVSDGAGLATAANQPAVYTDDTSTHATGTSEGNLLMAAATPTDGSVDANDIGALAMSTDRRLLVDAQIVGTDAALDVSGATVTVAGTGTLAVQEDGAALTALQLIDDAIVADDAAFTPATTKVMMAGFEYDDTTPDSVNEGDAGAARMSANRNIYTTIRDAAGNERGANVDASGNLQVDIAADSVGIGGGTQYTEDDAAAANPVGNAVILVRDDTPGTLTSTDGDNVAQRGTNYGAAFVQVVDSSGNFIDSFSGSGGTAHNDDAAFTIGGSSNVTPVAYLADETTPDSVDEGDVGVARMTLTRKPYAVITDATSENNAGVDASGHLQIDIAASSATVTVDGSGVTQPVSGTVTANLSATDNAVLDNIDADTSNIQTAVELIDDAIFVDDTATHTAATTKVMGIGAVATPTDTTVDANDIAMPAMSTDRRLHTDTQIVGQDANLTVDLGATDNAVLDSIDAAVNGTLTVGSHAVTNAGTFVVQEDGAALTALQLIDDVVYTDDTSTHATGTSKGAGIMAAATPTDGSVEANDIGMLAMSTDRRLHTDAQIVGQDANLTVDLGATDNAVLDSIDAAVNGTLTVGSHAVTNAGTFAVQISDTSFAVADGNALGEGVLIQGDDGTDRKNINVDATTGDVQVDVTNTVTVDGSGVTQPVSGTVTANLSATDNTVLDNIDTNTSNSATSLAILDDWDNGASDGASVSGDVAHDTADAGEPVKVGGKAYNFDGTVPGTAVAENDRANFISDVYGRQFVETAHPRFWHVSADYAAAQTNTTVKAAPGAGLKLYITDIVISNGATAGNVTLLDGSGGTVLFEIYPAVNGGASTNLRTPIALTANTLLAITSTTVTTHSVFVSGYIAP